MKRDHALDHLDSGISKEVFALRESGVETFESRGGLTGIRGGFTIRPETVRT